MTARPVRLQFHRNHLFSAAGARIKSIALPRQLTSLPAEEISCFARFSPLEWRRMLRARLRCDMRCCDLHHRAVVMVIRRLTAA